MLKLFGSYLFCAVFGRSDFPFLKCGLWRGEKERKQRISKRICMKFVYRGIDSLRFPLMLWKVCSPVELRKCSKQFGVDIFEAIEFEKEERRSNIRKSI